MTTNSYHTWITLEYDPSYSLQEWLIKIQKLIEQYGPASTLMVTADYEAVELCLNPEPNINK